MKILYSILSWIMVFCFVGFIVMLLVAVGTLIFSKEPENGILYGFVATFIAIIGMYIAAIFPKRYFKKKTT